MHYIIGTQVYAAQQPSQQHGPRSVTAQPTRRANKTLFESGMVYNLYNIEKTGDAFIYSFIDTNNEVLAIEFNSPGEADMYIASALGEALPDYDEFYTRRNG